ncbi:MAG: heme biosynthesis HemY N-terminal domain-containing protein [Pseudomonadota bacterium]
MRLGIVLLIGLFLGAFSAHFLLEDRGYVQIRFLDASLQTSVPGLIMILVALYVAIRILAQVLGAPRRIGSALGAREKAIAQGALTRGLSEISAGNLARGERILTRQAVRGDAPVLAYLEAARAAQRQGARARRDSWLKRANDHAPGDAPAVLITQAELEIGEGDLDRALKTLRRLETIRPRHARCLALQAQIYQQRQEWSLLDELLPRLKKEKALPALSLQALESEVTGHAITIAAKRLDGPGLKRRWKQLGRKQKDPRLTHCYVGALIQAGDEAEAAEVIKRSMRDQWQPELLYTVGQLSEAQQRRLQPQITAWRRKRQEDPALLFAAAAIGAAHDPLKAIARLESSLEQAPRLESLELYGRLLDEQGRHAEATIAFRSALAHTTEGRSSGVPARLEQLAVNDRPPPEPAMVGVGDETSDSAGATRGPRRPGSRGRKRRAKP